MDATPPEGPQPENLIEKNKKIAAVLDGLLGKPSEDPQHALGFVNFRGSSKLICCTAAIENAPRLGDMEILDTQQLVPDKLDYPVFSITTSKRSLGSVQITRYGYLPELVVSDNRVFTVNNIYYFSLSGKAIKITQITDVSMPGRTVEDVWENEIGGNVENMPIQTTQQPLEEGYIITDLLTEPPTERNDDYRLLELLLNEISTMQRVSSGELEY